MPERDVVKDVLRLFTYGLYVAASVGPDGPRAATLSWVTQVSFEPRLVAIAVRKGTAIHDAIRSSGRFALHIVGQEQTDFAKAFFKASTHGVDEIAGFKFTLSEKGTPVFDAAPAWLECDVLEEGCQGGDHAIMIAQVVASGYRSPSTLALSLRDTPWHYGG